MPESQLTPGAEDHLNRLRAAITPTRQELLAHPLYHRMSSLQDLQVFMTHHVFAVWDFMSLVKFLQRELTTVQLPWLPPKDLPSARLINEIVWGEETDIDPAGGVASHFQLYRRAMEAAGANTQPIDQFFRRLLAGETTLQAIASAELPRGVQHFVRFTFELIEEGALHKAVAAFTFGREDLIPDMFTELVHKVNQAEEGRLDDFVYYLERHIEVDGEDHGPLALQMLANQCGDDPTRWQEATQAAQAALEKRLELWDGIHQALAQPQAL